MSENIYYVKVDFSVRLAIVTILYVKIKIGFLLMNALGVLQT